jgi:hypothetical protein
LDVPYRKDTGATFYNRFPFWLVAVLSFAMIVMLARAKRTSRISDRTDS